MPVNIICLCWVFGWSDRFYVAFDMFIPFYHLHGHSGTIEQDNSTDSVDMPVGREVVEL